jgi:hypothetical protein
MQYELWDLETGNIINTYASEAEALEDVRELLAESESRYAEALSLGFLTERGGRGVIASGAVLAARAGIPTPRIVPGP